MEVTISYKNGIIFIEAKYLAPVNLRTTSEPRRDQIIRYLDLAAYHYLGWNPLDVSSVEALGTTRLREHIRKWITEWDLTYLDQGYKPDIEVTEVKQDYSENGDLEVESEDNSEA